MFPIGYGPTPSKRKDILLEQEVVKGSELVLHRKKVNITDEDVYMVLLMSLPPSFDNLVTNLESCPRKM
jgi:hypothetical protein